MSGRGASAAVLTELGKTANSCAHLVEIRLDAADGGTVYMTDSYRTITFGGNAYQALGHFLGYESLEESRELKVTQARLRLSGVDQTWYAQLLAKQYLGRIAVVYKAFFDGSEGLIVDPVAICQGPMDAPEIDEDPAGDKDEISVQVTSLGADIDRVAGRRTSVADQNRFFPADTAFKLCPQISGTVLGRVVAWGRPGVPAA
jgi:hypothetical protein